MKSLLQTAQTRGSNPAHVDYFQQQSTASKSLVGMLVLKEDVNCIYLFSSSLRIILEQLRPVVA